MYLLFSSLYSVAKMLEFAVIVESEHTWYNKQRNIFYLYSKTGVIVHS